MRESSADQWDAKVFHRQSPYGEAQTVDNFIAKPHIHSR